MSADVHKPRPNLAGLNALGSPAVELRGQPSLASEQRVRLVLAAAQRECEHALALRRQAEAIRAEREARRAATSAMRERPGRQQSALVLEVSGPAPDRLAPFTVRGEAPADGAPEGVLVIDDNEEGRRTVAEILTGAGYRVECAANGQAALAQLRHSLPPALILLDWLMPVMGGREFLVHRRQKAELLPIPVVLLAAAATLDGQGAALGVTGYLPKPIDVDELLATVAHYCP